MFLTPEEERRAQLRKEKMAQRRKKVQRMKLAIVGGCALAVVLIVVFMTKDISGSNTSSLSIASANTSAQITEAKETAARETIQETASELMETASSSDSEEDGTQTQAEIPAAASLDSPYAQALVDLAKQEPRLITMLQNLSDYPEDLHKMIVENSETLDFVLDYPEKKDTVAADTIGEVTKGTIPLLLQWDSRWGYSPYGDSIIGASGCGPTCIAMVASGLTGRSDITPAKVAEYSMEGGFLTSEADTKWDLMSYGCEQFGITGTVLSLEETAMRRSLEAGSPIICSMRPGDFTNGGHFIVLTGYQDGMFQVHDPNSKLRSEQLWSFDTLKGQIKNLWSYTLCD